MTKSIISTYEQEIGEQWLDNNIELKHPKDADGNRQGLKDAIKLVARRELGSAQLDGILEQITRLRNTTVHLENGEAQMRVQPPMFQDRVLVFDVALAV